MTRSLRARDACARRAGSCKVAGAAGRRAAGARCSRPGPREPAVVTRAGAPQRPLGLRAFDWVGRALRAVGLPLVRLEEEALLARASAAHGPGRLRRRPLPRAAAPPARLARVRGGAHALRPPGRAARSRAPARESPAHARHVQASSRDRRAPGSSAPLFVVGLPRTGTSILHELLAQDPGEPRADDLGGDGSLASARARQLRERPADRAGRAALPRHRPRAARLPGHAPDGRAPAPGVRRDHGARIRQPDLPHQLPGSELPALARQRRTCAPSTPRTAAGSSTCSGAVRPSAGC